MKRNKITLALSSILLSVSLVGCSSGDGLSRSAKDGKENEVEKAAIKLVKATKKLYKEKRRIYFDSTSVLYI